mgnify:CR=1 FL=1
MSKPTPTTFVTGGASGIGAAIVRAHLDAQGFGMVEVEVSMSCGATRLDLDNPWVDWALASMQRSTGKPPALLPNLGGTLPNDVFAKVLGQPTLWVPHSYPACAQHAPNEHLLGSVAREALPLMAGLFWDLGEQGAQVAAACDLVVRRHDARIVEAFVPDAAPVETAVAR